MKTLRRIAVCTLISAWLAGCSNNGSTSAPITNVSGGGGSGKFLNPNPSAVPVAPRISQQRPATIQQESVAQPAPVVNQQGHIVYNRTYNNIPKGSYGGSTYQVKRGDTLFYIAWITGNDFRDLAARNNIPAPYGLEVGQTIQVNNVSSAASTGGMVASTGGASKPVSTGMLAGTVVASQPTSTYSEDSGKKSADKMLPSTGVVASTPAPVMTPSAPVASTVSNGGPVSSWKWPTDGKIIDNFSASEGGNKGIDIAGSRGQSVVATASGRVVYAGNALRGYGNLIIIKHNDDYLSAYAHNDTMLVREQQEVQAGQKIATMGSTGTSSVRLHFEIRYKGKSVNPLRYLPQR